MSRKDALAIQPVDARTFERIVTSGRCKRLQYNVRSDGRKGVLVVAVRNDGKAFGLYLPTAAGGKDASTAVRLDRGRPMNRAERRAGAKRTAA